MSQKSHNTAFAADYYRMTGKRYSSGLSDHAQILLRHNLKYMYWLRKRQNGKLKLLSKLRLFCLSRKYGLEIGNAQIGKGIYLGHPYNITVTPDAVLGDYVSLHKGCTIGRENRGKRSGAPKIGNNVYVGINAVVVGNITIGDDVLIAPGSFVNFNVPPHSVVIGNPGIIKKKDNATQGYVNFTDC